MNGKPARRVKKTPEQQASLDREIVKAVVEDAVMEIAADVAAIVAFEPAAELLIAETPEEEAIFDIARVPYLGPSRVKALAAAGITTISELNEAPVETVAAIKGVGLKQAADIKNWVAHQLSGAGGAIEMSAAAEASGDMPPAPPVLDDAPANAAINLHLNDSDSMDPDTSSANQTAQDDLTEIDAALRRLKDNFPKKSRSKSLDRQMDKIAVVVSEVPEGRDHLSTYGKQKVARTLDQIASFLMAVAGSDKVSHKKQEAIGEELKELRKRLQKALDD